MRFTRTSHSTLLTEDGMHLRQRAEEILALGLIDFALMIEPFPLEDYHYIRLGSVKILSQIYFIRQ